MTQESREMPLEEALEKIKSINDRYESQLRIAIATAKADRQREISRASAAKNDRG